MYVTDEISQQDEVTGVGAVGSLKGPLMQQTTDKESMRRSNHTETKTALEVKFPHTPSSWPKPKSPSGSNGKAIPRW
eukprot:4909961-Pyramimonas_sp.AAC.1